MSILSWNCRGLGNLRAVPILKDLIRDYKPDVIFLCETRVNANKIEEVRVKIGFDCAFAVDREGRGGGVAVFWRDSFHCNIVSYANNFINLEVRRDGGVSWRFTGYYGYTEHHRRKEAWALLRTLANNSTLPWCIMGDFNDLLSNEDKCGRVAHPPWLMRGFREAVGQCNLHDIDLVGYPYTWAKSKGKLNAVEERLDRAMATSSWYNLFPDCKLINLLATISDHSPIFLRLKEEQRLPFYRKFKFEKSWLEEPDIEEVFQFGWNKDNDADLLSKMCYCIRDVEEWGRKIRNKYKHLLAEYKAQLEELRTKSDAISLARSDELRGRINDILLKKDAYSLVENM